jgi:hypothetical protein
MCARFREMAPGALVGIRPSMRKFGCRALSVEVCCMARVLPCVINRQVMMALLTLGVPTHALWQLYTAHVKGLEHLLAGGAEALRVCSVFIFTVLLFELSGGAWALVSSFEFEIDSMEIDLLLRRLPYSSPYRATLQFTCSRESGGVIEAVHVQLRATRLQFAICCAVTEVRRC